MTMKNIIDYFDLLKNADQENIPDYKIEIARFLKDIEYFLFKIKFILSIVGMIGSFLILFNILWQFLMRGYYFYYESPYMLVLIGYVSLGVFALSYVTYRRLINQLKFLREMIEE